MEKNLYKNPLQPSYFKDGTLEVKPNLNLNNPKEILKIDEDWLKTIPEAQIKEANQMVEDGKAKNVADAVRAMQDQDLQDKYNENRELYEKNWNRKP